MIKSWSFSRYTTYRQCPLKFRLSYIDKYPQGPKSEALERGDRIHKQAEAYLKGAVRTVPAELKNAAPELKEIRAAAKQMGAKVSVEETIALRSDWSPTTWDDWDGCWLRIKIDAKLADGPIVRSTSMRSAG
jgi:RecB family exonuclease